MAIKLIVLAILLFGCSPKGDTVGRDCWDEYYVATVRLYPAADARGWINETSMIPVDTILGYQVFVESHCNDGGKSTQRKSDSILTFTDAMRLADSLRTVQKNKEMMAR